MHEVLERRQLMSSYTLSALASFDGTNGSAPTTTLVSDDAGNLYVAAGDGGQGNGTVFEVAKGSGAITSLASFNDTDGANPGGSLVIDAAGNLYGTANNGGAHEGGGTLFEVAAGSREITGLADFDGADGRIPVAGLVADAAGNLYGTTLVGTVFELAKGSATISTLASVSNPGGVIVDTAGNLYGTATQGPPGDPTGDGMVFELAKGSGTITILASFDGADGAAPGGTLVADAAGNLYGTTSKGGAAGDGTVFEVAPGSGAITTLASFDGTDGAVAYSGVVADTAGNLYGTASAGGAAGDGTVFEVAKGSGTITLLASFDGTDGTNPGPLLEDAAGNFYGATYADGKTGNGTVFELSPIPTPTPPPADGALPAGTLGVAVSAKTPSAAIGGARARATVNVNVSNPTAHAIDGLVTVALYLSPQKSLIGATQLVSVTKSLTLKSRQVRPVKLKLASFPSLPQESYFVIAAVTAPDGTTTAAVGPTVAIAPAFVSVVASGLRPSTAAVAPGKKSSLSLTLQDMGNVLASGTATLTVTASTDPSGAAGTALTSTSLKVKLKPRAAKTYRVKFVVPPSLAAGRYFLAVTVNVAALGDDIASDGFAVSGSVLTIG